MTYTPITKLKKFSGKEDNAQAWINDTIQVIPYFLKDTANLWYYSLAQKPQNFNAFKIKFLRYFSNNNSINCLTSTFIIIKQGDTKALAELEANHAQAVNLVINESSNLDFKLKHFNNLINQKIKIYLRCMSATTVVNKSSNSKLLLKSRPISANLSANDIAVNISTVHILTSSLSITITSNILTAATNDIRKLQIQSYPKLKIGNSGSPTNSQFIKSLIRIMPNYLSLLITPEDTPSNNQETNHTSTPTNNILPATITKNKSLDAIFSFELKKLSAMLLFSGVTFEEKPITTMYINVKVDGHSIKLILDSGLADSIITKQLINQLDCQVDRTASTQIITVNGINSIIVPIKVLVMEATQYQALISNDWLSKTNVMLDWNMQELQLSQNSRHTYVPATCGHFKTTNMPAPLIKFKKKEKKPIWEAYQVSWTEDDVTEGFWSLFLNVVIVC
ncbi:hypothetical protein G9A89_004633 [Geosiphon pyriformis]|nr:hypothetical protein G9A89_004633 [Geosiphon pyriformis]